MIDQLRQDLTGLIALILPVLIAVSVDLILKGLHKIRRVNQ